MSLELKGVDVVVQGLGRILTSVPEAVAAAVYQEAEAIMTDSKANYVPVDTGVLRDSGFVTTPEVEGQTVSVTLGYGGAASAYALVQHERMDYHHEHGGPKYLERPFLDAANGMEERLAEKLRPVVDDAAR